MPSTFANLIKSQKSQRQEESSSSTSLNTIARNSMVLPLLASQINIMQKNVAKLVTKQGETPFERADSFFTGAKLRENTYEESLRQSKSPTRVGGRQQANGTSKKDGGFFSSIIKFFSEGLLSVLTKAGIIAAVLFGIGKYFENEEFRTSVNNLVSNFWNSFSPEFRETLMNGALTVVGVLVAAIVLVKGALIALQIAITAAALKIAAIGLNPFKAPVGPKGKGPVGPKGKVPSGGGRLGTILGLGAITGATIFGSNLASDESSFNSDNGIQDDQGMSSLEGAGLGLAAGAGVVGAQVFAKPKLDAITESKRGAEFKYNEKAGRVTQGTKFTSAKTLPQGQIIERMRIFAVKSAKKGWLSRIFSKIVSRVGIRLALKVATFLAGLIAAPVTVGVSTLISIAMGALLIYDLYLLNDLFFGEDGIEKELEDEDAMKGNAPTRDFEPTQTSNMQVDNNMETSPSPTSTNDTFDYSSYAQTLGQRESGGDYKKVNTLGFLGKYQFGAKALEDMGLVKQGVGEKGEVAFDDASNWTIAGGKEGFLNNPSLQEETMEKYTKMNFERMKKIGVINDTTTPETLAGFLGAAHIGGPGGAQALKLGKIRKDAYGTTTESYFKLGSSSQSGSQSGAQIALASTTADSVKMQAMTPDSIIPMLASILSNSASSKTPSPQRQQVTIPSTIDSELFEGLIARVSEYA